MVRHKRHQGLRLRSLFLWHRYVGLLAAAFVATLAVSGVLINYSDDLRLANHYVQTDWLLERYGISPPAIAGGYAAGNHWITQVGERTYFDLQEIDGVTGPLRGAVLLSNKVAIAAGDQLLLLTPQGELIDRLSSTEGMPDDVQAVGVAEGNTVLHTLHGDYRTDDEFLAWRPSTAQGARWAVNSPLPKALRSNLVKEYRGKVVSWERLLLDLHSGRFFGKAGVIAMNVAGLFLLVLAISGVWHFFQRKRR